ncbi:MAG: Gfo/Idh/MocA family oxidoreductase, partial [Planctomycetota bacterium]|nr:Gfo/Idh/MocA family oxidoreductase [Planctomycetota bacterium]
MDQTGKMNSSSDTVRVAIYGAGNFANRTHIPNLKNIEGVEIVAVSDINEESRKNTASQFDIPNAYADAHEMLAKEEFDALYSIVPAFARTDVETAAAGKGIHIFSEKPQAIQMETARRINQAIEDAGVISTVGYRERYRPFFQEAKRILSDKKLVHVRFQSFRGLPARAGEAAEKK